MSTLFCKWPANGQLDAEAYEAECTVEYVLMSEEIGGRWALVREDRNGNWTVPLYGPPWSFDGVSPIGEPASCAALRVDAVVVETPEWPEEDE